jgi:L-iditol 2-dehydrogenase
VPTGPRHYRERYKNNAEGIDKIAIGYTLPGLFSEYVLITEEIIDTGCILPFPRDDIPYFGAALAEPLSCVIAAQERIIHVSKNSPTSPRRAEIGPKRGGVTLIIGTGPMGLMHIEVAMSYQPRKIIVSELLESRRNRASRIFQNKATSLGIPMVFTDPSRLREVIDRETNRMGADDAIVALGIAKVQEESFSYLARGGVTVFFGGTPSKDKIIQVDTHRLHYDGIVPVGSSGSDPSDVARALEMITEGLIDPGNYVVKCGGLDAATSLIQAVRHQEIEGKGVIYPHTRSPLLDIGGWNINKEKDFLEEKIANY